MFGIDWLMAYLGGEIVDWAFWLWLVAVEAAELVPAGFYIVWLVITGQLHVGG
jgi:hypothetical protein